MTFAAHLRREAIAAAAMTRACPECGVKAGEHCRRTIRMADDGSIVELAPGEGEPMRYLHAGRRFPTQTGANVARL